jgi:hypothetical protein
VELLGVWLGLGGWAGVIELLELLLVWDTEGVPAAPEPLGTPTLVLLLPDDWFVTAVELLGVLLDVSD